VNHENSPQEIHLCTCSLRSQNWTLCIFPQACIRNEPHSVLKEDCISVVWLRQCGPTTDPRATCGPPQRFQWPAEAFRKNFKFEICWKACEVTFVSLNCFRRIKCICTRTMNTTFYVYHYRFCFIYFMIKLEGTALPYTLRWGTWLYNLCVFGALAFVVLKSSSGAMNSIPPNKSVHIYQLNATFSK